MRMADAVRPRQLRALVSTHRVELAAAVLLAVMAANLVLAVRQRTITNDEVVHIPAGYAYLVDGAFQLNNEHPPLAKLWAALPLLVLSPTSPAIIGSATSTSRERTIAYSVQFWRENGDIFNAISFWSRVMMVVVTLGLGVLIFVFGRDVFGELAALFGVALYSLEPTVLAHGRVVHTDIPAAFTYLLFIYSLYRYVEQQTNRRAILVGMAAGLALATKFSLVIVIPIALVVAAAILWRAPRREVSRTRILAQVLGASAVTVLIINATYLFQRVPLTPADTALIASLSSGAAGLLVSGLEWVSLVLPTYFKVGLLDVARHNQNGHAASLLGAYGTHGWWYYFPIAFALKTVISFLLVAVAALAWSAWRAVARSDRRHWWMLAPFALYALFAMSSNINIGVRHFLPAMPFVFILGGALLARAVQSHRRAIGVALAAFVLLWSGMEAVRTFPNYTPYMNQLAIGRPHWWYLSDSNVEWGDDVRALADYLKARGETRVTAALLGGWATLGRYGVQYVNAMPDDNRLAPDTRYTAIGASFLNGSTVPPGGPGTGRESFETRVDYFDAYRQRVPEAVFGGSIYLFREP